jgi:hypothetical protein
MEEVVNNVKVGQNGQYTVPDSDDLSIQRVYAAIVVGFTDEDNIVNIVYFSGGTVIGVNNVAVAHRVGLGHTFRAL